MLESEEPTQLDFDKFKAAVHFVCAECTRDELSRHDLHRILFLADMLRYLEAHEPLTGEEYVRQRSGPSARHLEAALRELAEEGALAVSERSFHGLLKQDFDSLLSAESNLLSEDERMLLLDVIAFACARKHSRIAELNHDEPWQSIAMGERIPYYLAFSLLPASEVTDDDFVWADGQARELGLVN